MQPCVKVIGADFELANGLESGQRWGNSVGEAAQRLLDEIPGYPRRRSWSGTALEWGRRFLESNGGSAYIDSNHLEINLPEHTRAEDHPALVYAGLQVAREAQVAASRKLPAGGKIHVQAAVSDRQESWGNHLNIMVGRDFFDEMFSRKPHLAGFVATHLATATLYTGQGAVGASNQRPACNFQLSQRADWFEEFTAYQTTHARPLLNLRDESHANGELARMHIIFFDRVLCPVANYLMAGATQLVLAMAEAGWADPNLLLDDPLEAAFEVSRDLTLQQTLRMARRCRQFRAVEIQQGLAALAGEFIASEDAGQAVPGAPAIVACWQETLDLLARRDLAALSRRCDWALKYLLLDRQRRRKGLDWQSSEMKYMDLLYASLDPEEGLFWQMAAAGQVEAMPAASQVERFFREPPDETRAYLRAHLLRRFGEQVGDMDWAWLRFRSGSDYYWRSEQMIGLTDPTRFGRDESEPLLRQHRELPELIRAVRERMPDEDPMDYLYGRRRRYRQDPWNAYPSQTPLLPGFSAY